MRFPSSYLPVGRPVSLGSPVQVGRPVQVGELLVDCLSSFGYLCFKFLLCGYVPLHLMYHLLHYNSIPYSVRYITLFSKKFLYYWNASTKIREKQKREKTIPRKKGRNKQMKCKKEESR
jgi:hypothetical protein